MKKERWIEILVVLIILGTLGYLCVRVVDMSGTLGSVDVKTSWTAERLNRIAAALPDIGVRVANEELSRGIQTAVLATKPIQAADGGWEVAVTVLDAQSSKKWTLPLRLGSKGDRQPVDILLGIGAEIDRNFILLSRLQEYSRNTHSNASVPGYIDAQASFVLYNTTGEEFVAKIANKMVDGAHEEVFHRKVENYGGLIKALQAEREAFTTLKQDLPATPLPK
jgi:hypothetical protein